MGQTQDITRRLESTPISSLTYEVDAHLLERPTLLPSTFSFHIQKLIAEVEFFTSQIEEHPIEPYLIHALDQRFLAVEVDVTAFHAGRDPADCLKECPPLQWSELHRKQTFLKLIKHLQRSYHIENKIREEYLVQLASLDKGKVVGEKHAFQSLRKGSLLQLEVNSELDLGLIMRLVFYYYLKMLKLNANQPNRQVIQFHTQTGRMLCLLVFHGYLLLDDLFQLFYHLICIDKGPETVLKKKLQEFHIRYNGQCLKHAHSIGLPKDRLQIIQSTARVYLDELYLKSLQEAEDPEIKNSDDVLMPIKVFPISRVKDKQRA